MEICDTQICFSQLFCVRPDAKTIHKCTQCHTRLLCVWGTKHSCVLMSSAEPFPWSQRKSHSSHEKIPSVGLFVDSRFVTKKKPVFATSVGSLRCLLKVVSGDRFRPSSRRHVERTQPAKFLGRCPSRFQCFLFDTGTRPELPSLASSPKALNAHFRLKCQF